MPNRMCQVYTTNRARSAAHHVIVEQSVALQVVDRILLNLQGYQILSQLLGAQHQDSV